MKRFLIIVLAWLSLFVGSEARAQSAVYLLSKKQAKVTQTGGAINVTRTSACIDVTYYNTVIVNLDYDFSGGGAATAINMTCTAYQTATCTGNARTVQVITGTTSAGVSTTVANTWTHPVAGADESWPWTVTNIPGIGLKCSITGTGANANDAIAWNTINKNP